MCRYLLSKRQVFTALDESITQVLLEIDALDRSRACCCLACQSSNSTFVVSDYSDRRRAAVNRALRLSDSIEQLKANMAGVLLAALLVDRLTVSCCRCLLSAHASKEDSSSCDNHEHDISGKCVGFNC